MLRISSGVSRLAKERAEREVKKYAKSRVHHLLAPLLAVSLVTTPAMGAPREGLSEPSVQAESESHPRSSEETISKIDRLLSLTDDQKRQINPILTQRLGEIATINSDKSTSASEKKAKFEAVKQSLMDDVRPLLTDQQRPRWVAVLKRVEADGAIKRTQPLVPLISGTYEEYLPSGSVARSIFGSSPASWGFGLADVEDAKGARFRFDLGLDSLTLYASGNKLFVLTPQASVEYREPLAKYFSAFAEVAAGPSYMDYSYDTPAGNHFGAKRFGAEGDLEVGLRYGRAQLSADYRLLTEPSGINLDGLEIALTYVLVKF